MATVEFVGQSAQDSSNVSVSTSRLINLYREPVVSSGVTTHVLHSVLGQETFSDLNTVLLRAMELVDGVIYSVAGGGLYSTDSSGISAQIGTILDDENTTISGNSGMVTIVAGGKYYVWDGAVLTSPTGGAFTDFGSVSYVGGYTVLTERNGRRFLWSDLGDAATLPALNFQTADSREDKIIRGESLNGRELIFKERSIEVWYITGQSGADAIKRVAGGTKDTGLKSLNLLSRFPGGLFFVGDDGIAYISDGSILQPVSISGVETALDESTPTNCFTYEDQGHKFMCIRFSDRPAWCYDISTGEWHERAETLLHDPWSVIDTVELGGVWYSGNTLAEINQFTRNNTDVSGPLLRRAVSKELYLGGQRFTMMLLEFLARVGYSDLGRDASGWIRTSRDGGNTWSEEKKRSFGGQGDYESRMVYRRLGQFRRMAVELNVSDPSDIPINSMARIEIK